MATQLIFNGEYIVGLQASRVYKSLSEKSLVSSELKTIEMVATSYYLVLVLEENILILKESATLVSKTLNEITKMFEQGFVEDTDVDQMKINLATLETSIVSLEGQRNVAHQLLKLQMGVEIEKPMVLSDSISGIIHKGEYTSEPSFTLEKSINYQLLETQENLMLLSLKREKWKFLPTISAFYQHQELLDEPAFNFMPKDLVGITASIPLFTSGQRLSKIKQAQLDLDKTRLTKEQASAGLILEFNTALNTYQTAQKNYNTNKESMELSQKIYNKSIIKYKEGIISSLDLTQSQNQYLTAQGKYYASVVEFMNAKAALDRILATKNLKTKKMNLKFLKDKQMKTSKLGIFALIVILFFAACSQDKKAELEKLKKQQSEIAEKIKQLEAELGDQSTIDSSKIVSVSVEEIKQGEFKHYIEVQGRLDGEENVDVQPEGMGGAVQSILVQTGQYVTKGQALARLNDAGLRDQLKSIESTYALAKENFERQERLWEQKIGSEMQYLQAKSNKDALESQISALKEQISMNTIKSPINGTVEEINIKVGQLSSPQSPIPAFRVVNFNTVKVKAEVAEGYSKKVAVGDNVRIIFPDLEREVDAKISAVSRYINPINRTFLVEVKIDPSKDGFKANMIAILKITDYKNDKAISIPVKYLQSDITGDFVYVVETNENRHFARKAFIKQGVGYNGVVEITEGLNAGDQIVTLGYLDIEEGEEIRF